uniref:Uncharacterized protein n=1 Tax=Arundo donax TaxID=35708 RepID=A0A0A9CBP0_ARUDO
MANLTLITYHWPELE